MRYSGFEVTMRGKKAKLGTDFLRKWQDETGRRWVAWSRAWKVTTLAGRWEMWVAGQKDVFKDFKINKRAQIVIVANSWVGATSTELGSTMCFHFTQKVYDHVGFNLPSTGSEQFIATVADAGEGCLIFYSLKKASDEVWQPEDVSHVGIRDGGNIIDINCLIGHRVGDYLSIDKHSNDPQHIKKVNPDGSEVSYKGRKKKAPSELKDLDGE